MADSSVHRIAWGNPDRPPAWRRVSEGERGLVFALVLVLAIASQFILPARFALSPRYIAPAVEVLALIGFLVTSPGRISRHNVVRRSILQVLLGGVAGVNLTSAVFLVAAIVRHGSIAATDLLVGGASVWITNVLVFGMWFWLTDRGGPGARAEGLADMPDLLFPQMTDDKLAADWEPNLLDYLYVSLTNATAFSPTDTMPLSQWVKALFSVQSLISLLTVGLVFARAVNVLPSS